MNYIDYIPSLQWLSAIITSGLILYLFPYRKNEVALSFTLFLVFNVIWSLTSALIFEVDDINTKILLNRLKISGVFCIVFALLWFGISLKQSLWKNKRLFIMLIFYPLIMCLIALSPWHELAITGYKLENFNGRIILSFKNGDLFSIHLFFARLYFMTGIYFIYKGLTHNFGISKKHTLFFVSLAMIPGFTDLIGVYFVPYFRYLNLVPVTFLLTSSVLAYSIIKYGFFKLIPIAQEKILINMRTPLFIWDKDFKLIDANKSAKEELKITNDNGLSGLKAKELLARNSEIQLNNSVYQVQHTEVQNDQNLVIGSYTLLFDITKLKEYQKELEENNNLINNLMNVLSHDIHGHIAQLNFLTDILKFDFEKIPNNEKEEIKEAIFGLSKELNSYMGDIVNWSREQKKSIQLNLTTVNLQDSLTGIILFLSVLAKMKNINVINNVSKEVLLNTDAIILEIILRNLIWNAIKHSKANSEITINYTNNSIIIENHAHKVDIALLNDFFTSENSIPIIQGLGVGLKICKYFANKIKHQIHFEQNGEIVKVTIKLHALNND
jgi:signal transduction histidine kinase